MLADVNVDDEWYTLVHVLVQLLHILKFIAQLLKTAAEGELGTEVLLVAVLMHKLDAAGLHRAQAPNNGDLLVEFFVHRALLYVVLELQSEERHSAVRALLLQGKRLLLVLQLLQELLVLLAFLDVGLKQRNVEDSKTDSALLEQFLVVSGFWKFLLAHHTVGAGYVVLHRAVRACKEHLLVGKTVCAHFALLCFGVIFIRAHLADSGRKSHRRARLDNFRFNPVQQMVPTGVAQHVVNIVSIGALVADEIDFRILSLRLLLGRC